VPENLFGYEYLISNFLTKVMKHCLYPLLCDETYSGLVYEQDDSARWNKIAELINDVCDRDVTGPKQLLEVGVTTFYVN
jgi:hypothetical protein